MRRFVVGERMGVWPEYHGDGAEGPAWIDLTADGIWRVVGEGGYSLPQRCEALLGLL